ncbi:ATP-dependent zinc metalloprotease FtsH [Candidatus Arthromitus sp. SFB-turkey]|uniref:ATP-dependent zinc metalloprotease FtsH n=1 Tax=Candidatus Arthromitus sp. SFB-turkey TaxID=1840217 RepID=UPI0007F4CF41|nr:ATP-dependent zinc metalloprotease FtsH [Candidatus Arthromitus sp. SFB-turkey]OAT89931.1 cell division protein FtsH [Candidatus Arthromitus sp. SFB-turkey]HJD00073.1 ATP-dependent zinc metalloprotease FtsH [Candidatus Dwaynia gallinarum]
MKKSFSNITAWIVIVVMVFIVGLFYFESIKTERTIPYSKFEQYWINDEVQSIKISEGSLAIEGTLKNREQFVTIVPQNRLNLLFDKYPKNGEVIEIYEEQSNVFAWLQFVPSLIIIVMSLGLWFLFMQQSQGGGSGRGVMNFGKSRARMATQDTKKVTFKEVAGAKEEKEELEEIVDFLKQPRRYIEMGARIPKGVLLFGPPGTGKTLLAKAVAGEAGVPFFSISGSDFVEMFVGVGASRVRDLFDQAKKNSPCIIFIDEIDAVGRHRGAGLGGGHDEREQTLNQLLVEMDGFGVNEGIIIIAATNRPDILDPALLRPGRFDRQIIVGAPDVKGREEILKIHVKNKPLSEEVKLDVLAKRTPGFTGADLENLTNEASLLAVRRDKKFISMDEMEEAITRVIAGPEKKSKLRTEKTNRLTAYHEAGHAVVSRLLDKYDKVHEISIIPRGMAGGYTMHLPDEDKDYISKSDLENDMITLLGGRVAEKLVLGDISTGAKNDIDRVSNIARKMVMEYGMSEEIGTISFGGDNEVFLGRDFTKSRNFSEELGSKIDREVKKIVDKAYGRTQTLLSENISKLHAVAKALLEKEKLDSEEFEELFKNS